MGHREASHKFGISILTQTSPDIPRAIGPGASVPRPQDFPKDDKQMTGRDRMKALGLRSSPAFLERLGVQRDCLEPERIFRLEDERDPV
jgi:hypothetical protein